MVENRLPEKIISRRNRLTRALSPFLPADFIDKGNSLQKVRKLKEDENRNIIVLSTHPSAADQPREYPIIWSFPEFQRTKFHVPTAYHIYNTLTRVLSWYCGVQLYPIVTADTVAEGKNKGHNAGYGNRAYFMAMKQVSEACVSGQEPAVIFLTQSAGVRSSLTIPKSKAAELLMTVAGTQSAVLLMGVEINGVDQYCEKTSGKNIGKRYTIRLGPVYRNEEILELLQKYRDSNNLFLQRKGKFYERKNRPYAFLDHWLFKEAFPPLVPPSYLGFSVRSLSKVV